jgi:hypothetical protein
VNGAEQYVLGTFERSSSQLGDIWSGLEWAEFLLDNLRSASFKLLPNENGVAAAKAEWVSEKKKPEGILYLTDHRIVFETTEEKVTKKILFIATEKETIRETAWEAPVGAIEEFGAEDKGGMLGFGVKELLTLTFARNTADVPKEVTLRFLDYADNELWEELIALTKTGAIETQKIEGAVSADTSRPTIHPVAPTQCPGCGGQLLEVFKGMHQIECEFCGTRVNLDNSE